MKVQNETDQLAELQKALCQFRDEQDWRQFHTPKNLTTALMVEAGELAELFQWMTAEESDNVCGEKRKKVEQEMADVLAYLLLLSDRLKIDLVNAGRNKLEINRIKYPLDKAKGNSKKYDEY